MRHGSVSTLLLGVGLVIAPAHSMAAEAGEAEREPGEMGYVVARGSFDPAPLCADAPPDCTVIENQVVLAEDVAIGKLHGAAKATITYRPFPQCKPLTSTAWIEFTGEGSTASEALGELEMQGDIDLEVFSDEACHPNAYQVQDTGVWQVKPLGNDWFTGEVFDVLAGEVFLPNALGVNTIDFALDVTRQTEAPEGFFGQDGSSDPGTLSFFFDELVPGQ